ncbi:hypothetical protein DFJ73DRAFT_518707 [Zopfochytrium polystomum]|nr:hypothetical protein DFJ73DRAFT_518707 [Zopfochytrium polystomum]
MHDSALNHSGSAGMTTYLSKTWLSSSPSCTQADPKRRQSPPLLKQQQSIAGTAFDSVSAAFLPAAAQGVDLTFGIPEDVDLGEQIQQALGAPMPQSTESPAGVESAEKKVTSTATKVVPAFLSKLYSIVNDNSSNLIRWSSDGRSFIIENCDEFAKEVLPRFFKHSNLSSFVRQLNMYGFHKVLPPPSITATADAEPLVWEFENPHFQRDQPDLLCLVVRKKMTISNGDMCGKLLLKELAAIRRHQLTISADMKRLQRESQMLWTEFSGIQEQHRRHQETVEKILRFLASVYWSRKRQSANQSHSSAKRQKLVQSRSDITPAGGHDSALHLPSASCRSEANSKTLANEANYGYNWNNFLPSDKATFSDSERLLLKDEFEIMGLTNEAHLPASSSLSRPKVNGTAVEPCPGHSAPLACDNLKKMLAIRGEAPAVTQFDDYDLLDDRLDATLSLLGIDPSSLRWNENDFDFKQGPSTSAGKEQKGLPKDSIGSSSSSRVERPACGESSATKRSQHPSSAPSLFAATSQPQSLSNNLSPAYLNEVFGLLFEMPPLAVDASCSNL